MVCTPVRSISTGTACSGSVTRITSELQGLTRVVWPSSPKLSSTAWPRNTPLCAPRLISSRCRRPLSSTSTTSVCHGGQGGAQPAQLGVLALQGLEAHRLHRQLPVALAQGRVLGLQGFAGGQALLGPVPCLARGADRQLQGIGRGTEVVAGVGEPAAPAIEHHEHDRQDGIHGEAETRSGYPSLRCPVVSCAVGSHTR